eukprot:6094924-Amphidinium_carterae.1
MHHGDDFVAVGPRRATPKVGPRSAGPRPGILKQITVLNRTLVWKEFLTATTDAARTYDEQQQATEFTRCFGAISSDAVGLLGAGQARTSTTVHREGGFLRSFFTNGETLETTQAS